MINVRRQSTKILDPCAPVQGTENGDPTYDMTALLAMAVAREHERSLQDRRSARGSWARRATMAGVTLASVMGLVTMIVKPHINTQREPRVADHNRSALLQTIPSAMSRIEAKRSNAHISSQVAIAQPGATSTVEPHRVTPEHSKFPLPPSPSLTPGISVARSPDSGATIKDIRAIPSVPTFDADLPIPAAVSVQQSDRSSVIERPHPERALKTEDRDRLAAIDALRALRSR
jgi:hypothetical protein